MMQKLLLVVGAILIVTSMVAEPVSAEFTERDRIRQGIRFYDPNSKTVSTCSPGKGSDEIVGGSNQERIWNWLRGVGLSGNQAAGVMGNLAQESQFSPARHENSKAWGTGGWSLAQWTATRRTAIARSLPESIKSLYAAKYGGAPNSDGIPPGMSIEDNNSLLDHVLTYMKQESEGRTVLGIVEAQGYGKRGDNEWETLKKQETLADAVVFWHNNFEVSDDSKSAILDGRLGPAQQILTKYGSGESSDGVSSGDACNGTDTSEPSEGSTAVLETANKLAWHHSTRGKSFNNQATSAYQSAAKEHFPGGYGNQTYADCTYFVATLMRESGVDKNFPIGTIAISAYLRKNQDKYKLITNPKFSDLEPGDIIQHTQPVPAYRASGHIMIYSGEQKGDDGNTYHGIDASKFSRVPGYITKSQVEYMFTRNPVVIARPIL